MKKRFALKNYEIEDSIDEIVEVIKWSWYQTCEIANYISMYNSYKDIRFPIESNSLPKKPVSVSLNNRRGIQRIIHGLLSQDRSQLTSLPRY